MHGDRVGEVGVLCGSAGVYRGGCTVDVTLVPSHPETSFGPAVADDFCCGGESGWCPYEGGVVPVTQGCSETRNVLYFFVNVVHEKGEEGVG